MNSINKYTIKYQYGTYSGTEIVYARDGEEAINKMWRTLKRHMTLSMAYQSAEIVDVEYDYQGD
jgi:hypothetical protein